MGIPGLWRMLNARCYQAVQKDVQEMLAADSDADGFDNAQRAADIIRRCIVRPANGSMRGKGPATAGWSVQEGAGEREQRQEEEQEESEEEGQEEVEQVEEEGSDSDYEPGSEQRRTTRGRTRKGGEKRPRTVAASSKKASSSQQQQQRYGIQGGVQQRQQAELIGHPPAKSLIISIDANVFMYHNLHLYPDSMRPGIPPAYGERLPGGGEGGPPEQQEGEQEEMAGAEYEMLEDDDGQYVLVPVTPPACPGRPAGAEPGPGGERCGTYDEFFEGVFNTIFTRVHYLVTSKMLPLAPDPVVNVVVCFDGVPPVLKWMTQLHRRRACIARVKNDRTQMMREACRLTAFGDAMMHLQDFAERRLFSADSRIRSAQAACIDTLTVLSSSFAGEGEVKMIDALANARGGCWDMALAVTDDSDALVQLAARLGEIRARDVYLYSPKQAEVLQANIPGQPDSTVRADDVEVAMREVAGPHRHCGLFHVLDDFFVRFLDETRWAHPMGFVVPLLLYGGFEMVPSMIPGGTERRHLQALERAVAACRDVTDFHAAFRRCLEAHSQSQQHTSNRREKALLTESGGSRDASERAMEVECRYYYCSFLWATFYALGDPKGVIEWYGDPGEELHRQEAKHLSHQAARASVRAMLRFLSANRDLLPLPMPLLRQPGLQTKIDGLIMSGAEANVCGCIRVLYGLYLLHMSDDGSTGRRGAWWWHDRAAVERQCREYEQRCLCTCDGSGYNPRAVITNVNRANDSFLDTQALMNSLMTKNVQRLFCVLLWFASPPVDGGGAADPGAARDLAPQLLQFGTEGQRRARQRRRRRSSSSPV